MLVYLESLKTPGDVKLAVSTPNLEGASITIPVR
jgi:hypothetical protein